MLRALAGHGSSCKKLRSVLVLCGARTLDRQLWRIIGRLLGKISRLLCSLHFLAQSPARKICGDRTWMNARENYRHSFRLALCQGLKNCVLDLKLSNLYTSALRRFEAEFEFASSRRNSD